MRKAMRRLGARRYWAIWVAVVPLLAWALVRGLGLDSGNSLAPLMTLTPWVALAALFVFGVAAALENWAAALAAGLALTILALAVLPRAFGEGEAVPAGATTVTVLSVNAHAGAVDPEALVELVADLQPDLLAVQEMAPPLDRRLRRAGLGRYLPESVVQFPLPSDPKRRPGIGTYARLPLRHLAGGASSSLRVLVELEGRRNLRLVDFHPLKPLSDPQRWRDALAGLPSAGHRAPWMVAGDFNATPDEAAFREVLDRGYRDAATVTGDGLQMTWPVGHSFPPLVAIDHVLVDERLGIADFGAVALPGSDHKAVWAEVFQR